MNRVAFRAHRLIQSFQRTTPNHIWPLLLNSTNKTRVQKAENWHALGLGVHDVNGSWNDVSTSSPLSPPNDVQSAPKASKLRENSEGSEGETSQALPTWKLVYFVAHKTNSAAKAQHAFTVVRNHISASKSNTGPDVDPLYAPLLLLTANALARFNLLSPLRTLTEQLLALPNHEHQQGFFANTLLQILSSLHVPSQASEDLILLALDTMQTQKLSLEDDTYTILLSSPCISPKVARRLKAIMQRAGRTPNMKETQALLKAFRKSAGMQTGGYHDQWLKEGMKRFDALFTTDKNPLHLSRSPWTEGRPSIYDLTSTLQSASFDKTVSTAHLIRLFERIRALSGATVVTYTIFLRGLYHRKKYAAALKYWDELLQSGLRLDKQALSVGLKILVRVDQLPRVLSTLETFALRPAETGLRIAQVPIKVDVSLMNDLMRALLHNSKPRPDVVFLLWDWMEAMYGVFPDAETLENVLRAAMKAMRMDDSIRGTMATLQLSFRRRRHKNLDKETIRTREEYISAFTTLVGTAESGTRLYRSGVWHENRPAHAAREVFYDVVLGNYPQLQDAQSPVVPYKIKPEIGGGVLTGLGFTKPGTASHHWGEMSELDASVAGKLKSYPGVLPTDRTFHSFILLLGFSSQQGLVGLALSWMHSLNITPSKDTLATALVFWSEVGMRSPLVERFGSTEGAYGKLERWLQQWVGEKGMPTPKEFEKASVYIESFRSS